ncbi:hypothetical protein [Azospirillum cavernae]|uniref:hypothetical protein n=1 Tax=Azospirillum cavernae TaxID=2320860 RepID=UPI001314A001|nr:hypothetical protein [Azospirillum cavernae]
MENLPARRTIARIARTSMHNHQGSDNPFLFSSDNKASVSNNPVSRYLKLVRKLWQNSLLRLRFPFMSAHGVPDLWQTKPPLVAEWAAMASGAEADFAPAEGEALRL